MTSRSGFSIHLNGQSSIPYVPAVDTRGRLSSSQRPAWWRQSSRCGEVTPMDSPINLPPWDGQSREMGLLWKLHKGPRVAVCHLWTPPSGGEARLEVDGEWHRGEAGRNGARDRGRGARVEKAV